MSKKLTSPTPKFIPIQTPKKVIIKRMVEDAFSKSTTATPLPTLASNTEPTHNPIEQVKRASKSQTKEDFTEVGSVPRIRAKDTTDYSYSTKTISESESTEKESPVDPLAKTLPLPSTYYRSDSGKSSLNPLLSGFGSLSLNSIPTYSFSGSTSSALQKTAPKKKLSLGSYSGKDPKKEVSTSKESSDYELPSTDALTTATTQQPAPEVQLAGSTAYDPTLFSVFEDSFEL